MSGLVVAIDGPAAAGKGTLARRLAAALDLAYLDTGSLYRAVALALLRAGSGRPDEATATAAARRLDRRLLGDPALRDEATGRLASMVAAMPGVRAALLDLQRDFAAHPPDGKAGAVLDGRDVGTVVCPDATVKLFVTASAETRALRRHGELAGADAAPSLARVRAELVSRDARDSARATAPLVPAADAHLLDTSDLSIEEVFARAKAIIETARTRRS